MSEEGDFTLGELVRSVSSLVVQVSKLSDKLDEHRDDIARRFDDLNSRYVSRELHVKDIAEVHARQDNYQRQTDVIAAGLEDEVRKLQADADRREAERQVELTRIETQRHNDRVAYTIAFLALLGGLLAAILPGLLS